MAEEPLAPSHEEPEQPIAPPIAVPAPKLTTPIGWLVSGFLLAIFVAGAVGSYLYRLGEEREPVLLDDTLKTSVKLASGAEGRFKESFDKGIEDVLEKAIKAAPKSDSAARVALVASRELDEEPPEVAIKRLRESKDEVSHQFVELYGGSVVTEGLVDEFENNGEEGFTVELARVQAREMLDLPSGRDELIDPNFRMKFFVSIAIGALIALIGGVALVAFIVMRVQGNLKPVGFGGLDKADGDRLISRFAIYLAVFAGVGFVGASLAKQSVFENVSPIWIDALNLTLVLIVSACSLYIPIFGIRDSLTGVIKWSRSFWKHVGIGLFGYLCTIPIILVVLLVVGVLSQFLPEPSHPISQDFATASGLDWFGIFFTAAVLAPILEEITFRGLLLPALATRLRPIVSVVACGLLFAAIHPQGPLVWPALATTGGVAAYLRYYSGSLVPSIVLHMVHNGLIFAFSTLMA